MHYFPSLPAKNKGIHKVHKTNADVINGRIEFYIKMRNVIIKLEENGQDQTDHI